MAVLDASCIIYLDVSGLGVGGFLSWHQPRGNELAARATLAISERRL